MMSARSLIRSNLQYRPNENPLETGQQNNNYGQKYSQQVQYESFTERNQ